MSYSAARSERPFDSTDQAARQPEFFVFTNSGNDYHVTVRSRGSCMVRAERLADEIARMCGHCVAQGVPRLVAVLPSPDRFGWNLAFRVFDAGIFRNRPHTLAIVAVAAPRDELQSAGMIRLLAALRTPQPGAFEYRLPTADEMTVAEVAVEPFTSLSSEVTHANQRSDTPIVVSDQPRLAEQVCQLLRTAMREGRPRHRRRILVTGAIAVLLAVCMVFIWLWISGEGGRSQDPNNSLPFTRDELVACLNDSGVPIVARTDLPGAAKAVVATAKALEDRLKALATELEGHIVESPRDNEPTLDHHHRLWASPLILSGNAGSLPTKGDLDHALRVHHKYQEALRRIEQLLRLDRDGEEFARALEGLRMLLSS